MFGFGDKKQTSQAACNTKVLQLQQEVERLKKENTIHKAI